MHACRGDLQKPLLQNGSASQADLENHPHLDGAPSMAPSESTMSTLSSDDESPAPTAPQSSFRRLLDSPTLATACCVFLCFILKVVQQVGLASGQHNSSSSQRGR